jgi:hypothetical protein
MSFFVLFDGVPSFIYEALPMVAHTRVEQRIQAPRGFARW